ncbi:MAG: ATP-binding protein [Litoreibacter sp.]
MDAEYYKSEMVKERRARLTAERLLEQKQAQLQASNHKLSQHSLSLSGQIIDQRKILEQLQDENSQAAHSALKANHKALAAERLLWDAVKSIEDGFALFDAERKLVAANTPYLSLFKNTTNVGPGVSMENILDLCIADNLIDREGMSEQDWCAFMLDRLKADIIAPVTLKLINGVYIKLTDRRTSDGGIVSLAFNITDSIERETELEKARDEALAGERAKSTFLAKMSHELRTPINGVLGMADLLRERDLDEEMDLYVETIRSSGTSILNVVSNVLEYAMLEAGGVKLESKPFDPKAVLEEICGTIAPKLDEKPVNLIVEIDPRLTDQLIGDQKRLKQALINLLDNAVKFTERGHITVSCLINPSTHSDRVALTIAVTDSGPGIDVDLIDHIFGGFNQIEDGHSRAHDGVGLGLSIVNKLVEAMGGELVLNAQENSGARFEIRISFPRVQSAKKPFPSIAAEPELRQVTRVLAAEDNKTNQLVFRKMVKDLDIELTLVENGLKAVEAYKDLRPDLIFMDISMPEMDGMEATQQIRWFEVENRLDAVTIVAMTAHAMEGDEARIRDCGLDEYLTKPLSKTAIVEMIAQHSRNNLVPEAAAQAS